MRGCSLPKVLLFKSVVAGVGWLVVFAFLLFVLLRVFMVGWLHFLLNFLGDQNQSWKLVRK